MKVKLTNPELTKRSASRKFSGRRALAKHSTKKSPLIAGRRISPGGFMWLTPLMMANNFELIQGFLKYGVLAINAPPHIKEKFFLEVEKLKQAPETPEQKAIREAKEAEALRLEEERLQRIADEASLKERRLAARAEAAIKAAGDIAPNISAAVDTATSLDFLSDVAPADMSDEQLKRMERKKLDLEEAEVTKVLPSIDKEEPTTSVEKLVSESDSESKPITDKVNEGKEETPSSSDTEQPDTEQEDSAISAEMEEPKAEVNVTPTKASEATTKPKTRRKTTRRRKAKKPTESGQGKA